MDAIAVKVDFEGRGRWTFAEAAGGSLADVNEVISGRADSGLWMAWDALATTAGREFAAVRTNVGLWFGGGGTKSSAAEMLLTGPAWEEIRASIDEARLSAASSFTFWTRAARWFIQRESDSMERKREEIIM